jgi:tripartite-type tricarboxylate transporter receptor subunit TctC
LLLRNLLSGILINLVVTVKNLEEDSMKTKRFITIISVLLSVGALCLVFPSHSLSADFSGKKIEWTIPFGVGGGTDVWARFFGPLLTEALPGRPTIVVVNVPGGGSITGANQFAARATADGLSILGTSASTLFPAMLGDLRVKYDYAKWVPVLASPTGGVIYAQPSLGVKGPKDLAKLRGKNINFAAQSATSMDLVPLLTFRLLELDIKAVFGMKSRGEGRLTFERGETGVDFQTTSAYIAAVKPLVAQGKAVPLFSLGMLDDKGQIVRDPSFPEIPSFVEFYREAMGREPAGVIWEAWLAFFTAGFSLQKMLVLPKDTPTGILNAYRNACSKIVSAPDFVKRAGEEIGVYPQALGAAAERHLGNILKMDPKVRDWVRNWLTTTYNVKF